MPYPYYSNYQPYQYQSPIPDHLTQLRQQYQPPQQQNNNGIIWVQGEEGAKAYMVAPGNSVFLMDSEAAVFYIKSSDASGMPMPLRIFDYTERTANKTPVQPSVAPGEEYVTRQEFDALVARLDEITIGKEEPENEQSGI